MIPILVNPPIVSKTPSKVDESKFYGVCFWQSAEKKICAGRGMITRTSYSNGQLIVRSPNGFTGGNGWDYTNTQKVSDLPMFIQQLIQGRNDVYEFETFLELAKWVSEKV